AVGVRLHPFERGFAVIRLDDGIAMFMEELASKGAHGLVIFDEQNGSPFALGRDLVRFGLGGEADLVIGVGKIDLESRSVTELAINKDMSSALLDDAVDGGEAKTGAFAQLFGGEEGLKDAGDGGFIHAATGVADGEENVFSGRHALMLIGESGVEFLGASLENKLAAPGHSVARVDRQVDDDLVELGGIGFDDRGGGFGDDENFDIVTHQRAEKFADVAQAFVEIEQTRLNGGRAAEGEELASERRSAFGRFLDVVNIMRGFSGGIDAVVEKFGAGVNDSEDVIEIVGNATGQASNGFHFLRLMKLAFGFFQGGDVAGDGRGSDDVAFGVAQGGNGDGNVEALPIFCDPLRFVMVDSFAARNSL